MVVLPFFIAMNLETGTKYMKSILKKLLNIGNADSQTGQFEEIAWLVDKQYEKTQQLNDEPPAATRSNMFINQRPS